MKRRAALALIALAFTACRGGQIKTESRRVVSISPSTTEAVFAIGAGSLVVGRSRYCDYPPEAASLPVVGGFSDPNVEAILALKPSLVIGAHGPAGPTFEERLRSHGIDTYFPETESLAQIEEMITGLGARLGHADDARAVVDRIEKKRRAVEAAVKDRQPVRALLLFDVAPIVVAGPGGFPDEILRLAGGRNVITAGGAYPTIDTEHLLALDPAVILDGASDEHTPGGSRVLPLRDAPGWRDLTAMKKGNVRQVSVGTVLRPGPRIGDGLVAMAKAVHGADLAIAEGP